MTLPQSMGGLKWLIWRIWLTGFATKTEVCTQWTLEDLLDAHDALNYQQESEARELDKSKPRGR